MINSLKKRESNLHMGGSLIVGLGTPTNPQHAVNKQYVDSKDSAQVSKRGDTMIGDLNMRNNLIKGLPTTYPPIYQGNEAVSWQQAVRLTQDSVREFATKEYVDNNVTSGLASVEYVDDSISNLASCFDTTCLASRSYVDESVNGLATTQYVDDSVVDTSGLATREYVDEKADECVNKSGGQMTGSLDMGGNSITNISNPTRKKDVVNKSHVDNVVTTLRSYIDSKQLNVLINQVIK